MTQHDFEQGQILNFQASENFEHGTRVTGVAATPVPTASGPLSSANLTGTITTGVSWLRVGVALLPLLFRGKKK